MPLPLIPVLIGGAALLAGGYGVKKGLDAKENFDRAKDISADAQRIYDDAVERLEEAREEAQASLEDLGRKKISIHKKFLLPFIETAQKIKNIEHNDDFDFDTDICITADLAEIQQISLEISSVLASGATALSSGALAGFGAFGAAGALASASTGTAISALSGVAAPNATLAWFGGGALAAGGLGMAGGTFVLGGIVAAPVLAVGGLVLASKSEEAIEDARSNLSKAKAAAESMRAACTGAQAIMDAADELRDIIEELTPYCYAFNRKLQAVVNEEINYSIIKADPQNRFVVKTSFELAKTVSNILKTPLFDDAGAVTRELRTLLRKNTSFLRQLALM